MFATKTALIVFCKEEILIWAIPPLSPRPSDLPNHTPPLFKIPFLVGIVCQTQICEWMLPSSWYFECWESIYLGMLFSDSKIQRFKIDIKPDLSDASLHFINKLEIVSNDFMEMGSWQPYDSEVFHERYMVCDDALVYFWRNNKRYWGTYAGLTSPLTNVVALLNGQVNSISPTSCRFVYIENWSKSIVVVDLF